MLPSRSKRALAGCEDQAGLPGFCPQDVPGVSGRQEPKVIGPAGGEPAGGGPPGGPEVQPAGDEEGGDGASGCIVPGRCCWRPLHPPITLAPSPTKTQTNQASFPT